MFKTEQPLTFSQCTIHAVLMLAIIAITALFLHSYCSVTSYYLEIVYFTLIMTPVYSFLIFINKAIKNRYKDLLIGHFFLITLWSYFSLYQSYFDENEFFAFTILSVLGILFLQFFYSLVAYICMIAVLMLFAAKEYGAQIGAQKELLILLFVVALCVIMVLHIKEFVFKRYKTNLSYVKKVMNVPGAGYVLFEIEKDYKVVDFSEQIFELIALKSKDENDLRKAINEFLNANDNKIISNLIEGQKHKIDIKSGPRLAKAIELSFTISLIEDVKYLLVQVLDVSEYQSVLEELEISEEKYKNLYSKNKAGVFTLDKNGVIVKGNEGFFNMLDYQFEKGDVFFSGNNYHAGQQIISEILKTNSYNYQLKITIDNKQKHFVFSSYLNEKEHLIESSMIDVSGIQEVSLALEESEEKYKLIFEESNDAILILEEDRITECNRKAIDLFGLPQLDLLEKNLYDLSARKNKQSKTKYDQHKNLLKHSRVEKFNWEFKRHESIIEAEVAFIKIVLSNHVYYQCVIKDNTDHNQSFRSIQNNQKNFKNILKNIPEGIIIKRGDKTLFKNPEIEQLLGENENIASLLDEVNKTLYFDALEEHLDTGSKQNIEIKINTEEGLKLVDVTIVSTSFEDKPATLMILKDVSVQYNLSEERLRAELAEETNKQLASEIMERIRTERLLEEQFLRTRAILDSSSNTLLITLDSNAFVSSFNLHAEKFFNTIYGKQLKANVSFQEFFKEMITPSLMRLFLRQFSLVKIGKSKQFEVKLESDKTIYWLDIFMNPILDTDNRISEISLVAHDITEKKINSIEIEESLKEKEILLKEIHHRVKNNLQVISSILNLQSSFIEDEKTLDILQESRNRIRSMAIIHENLYRTEDFSSINFSSYLSNLINNLISSYRIGGEIVLKTDIDEVDLILDQAIPCGLLVNELITNALKYAWNEGEKGIISVVLKEENNKVSLCVGDNGKGLPDDFDQMKTETLGLQLVSTLVEQLDGNLAVEVDNGTNYLINFENNKSVKDV